MLLGQVLQREPPPLNDRPVQAAAAIPPIRAKKWWLTIH
jgi:hypothetical protein